MSLVRMVQAPVHQVVNVVAVRHRLVAAVRAVLVAGVVATLILAVCALVGVAGGDFQAVLLDHVALAGRVMQMAVVQVVHVVAVFDGGVAAVGTVFVVVVVMDGRVFRVHGY